MMPDDVYRLFERKDIKSKTIKSLEYTKGKNNEHAFDFCSGNDVIITDIEEGSEYHIDIRNKCPVGTNVIGNFHTHTHLSESKGDTIPSSGDMIETIDRDLDFMCVSGNGHSGSTPIVRCFNKNEIKSEIDTILGVMKWDKNEDNIRKSSRLISEKMAEDKTYLNKMSHTKKYKIL